MSSASSLFFGIPSLSTSNISLYFLPIVYFLAFSPHEIKLLRLGTRYNNNKPRDPVDFRKGDPEVYKQKVEKLGSIHHNGMESFPLFGITLLAANLANLPTPYLNSFALTYTLSRVIYNVVYYTQNGFWTDSLRTAVYVGGMFGNLWVLWGSAAKVAGGK